MEHVQDTRLVPSQDLADPGARNAPERFDAVPK
jgi:hypothetical protein